MPSALPAPLLYVELFRASPIDRIRLIKCGVPASKAKRMISDLHLAQHIMLSALNLSTATINRKASRDEAPSLAEGERVIGVARLIGCRPWSRNRRIPMGLTRPSDWLHGCVSPCPPWVMSAPSICSTRWRAEAGIDRPRPEPERSLYVSQTIWRIATDTRDYEAHDLTGAGAKITGGRWNEARVAMVYAAQNRALACLDTFVHPNAGGLLLNRYLVAIAIPDDIWKAARMATPQDLGVGWDAQPAGRVSVALATKGRSTGLQRC